MSWWPRGAALSYKEGELGRGQIPPVGPRAQEWEMPSPLGLQDPPSLLRTPRSEQWLLPPVPMVFG